MFYTNLKNKTEGLLHLQGLFLEKIVYKRLEMVKNWVSIFGFYINYEECKLYARLILAYPYKRFILTMRNVNPHFLHLNLPVNKFYINYEECKSSK